MDQKTHMVTFSFDSVNACGTEVMVGMRITFLKTRNEHWLCSLLAFPNTNTSLVLFCQD